MPRKPKVRHPYIPEGRKISYVGPDNPYMQLAKEYARLYSQDEIMPGASIVVKDRKVIGIGANGSDYHKKYPCKRKELKCKTGEGYELCEGCHPKNHSEPTAIRNAVNKGNDTKGADLYLWGHWWCCKPCWDAMGEAGIRNVYLLEDSEKLFNKDHPENIVGKQFEKGDDNE